MKPKNTILFLLFLLLFLSISISISFYSNNNEIQPTPKLINRNNNPKQENAVVISIDLCPSSKKYEKQLFVYLEGLGKRLGKPLPIAVCPSGLWMTKHSEELEEIKSMDLDITWVNHSYSHPVKGDFLNNPKVDFEYEVLATEAVFKKFGLKFSKFFRFPGLVSNKKRLEQLSGLGYTALGADAWLAKGQKIKGGSIVLIHGNGNEVPGVIAQLIKYLDKSDLRITSVQEFVN